MNANANLSHVLSYHTYICHYSHSYESSTLPLQAFMQQTRSTLFIQATSNNYTDVLYRAQ